MRTTRAIRLASTILAMTLAHSALAETTPPRPDTLAPWYAPASQRAQQFAAFTEIARRDVVDFQPFRAELTATEADGTALRLISLNPYANAWFLLETGSGAEAEQWHLENPAPELFALSLDPEAGALVIETPAGRQTCTPWDGALAQARASDLPYAPLCDAQLFLRNPGSGSRTMRESVTEFLRGYVPFGESLIDLVRGALYTDAWMESGQIMDAAAAGETVAALGRARLRQHPAMRSNLRADLVGGDPARMEAGAWYALDAAPGIYASIAQPGLVHPDILNRRGETNALDGVENNADVYLFAFDLDRFELRYETGTDHPAVTWSPRPSGINRRGLPGPDGFDTLAPLAMTGMLNPALGERVAAIFAGGFKREHAAFRSGPYASGNQGHHYGFVVHGVTLSRLQPGLATLFSLDDGSIHMRTWREEDQALLPRIRFARQNGLPLVEPGPDDAPVAGPMVRQWVPGNWMGSGEAQLRTLRGGACMRQIDGRPFLHYAVFTAATPSAMTRVFQAYGCDYAMLLDMNSLELAYGAIFTREGETRGIVHLDHRMSEADQTRRDGTALGRFVDFPDNRDFFYLLRR